MMSGALTTLGLFFFSLLNALFLERAASLPDFVPLA
jgi:hypothetical protein